MIRFLTLALAFCCAMSLTAQSSAFEFSGTVAVASGVDDVRTTTVDLNKLRKVLLKAPLEFQGLKSNTTLSLPLPNGDFADFTAYNSPLQTSHPELGGFKIHGPWGGGRISTSDAGISVVARGPNGYFIIDPIQEQPGQYRVSEYGDFMAMLGESQGALSCGYDDTSMPDYSELEIDPDMIDLGEVAGTTKGLKAGNEARELRVYDLIMTCTGEFAAQNGGTVASVSAAFNTAANTINGIFENELGIRMNLIILDTLIFLDGALDGFATPTVGTSLLGEVLPAFQMAGVSADQYDLGHILTSGCSDVGGVVGGRACTGGKTRGVTCVRNGNVVGAALRIMAHEVAHQFAVGHSWNTCPGSEGQRASDSAFEPGSGTTIMSYSGACSEENIGSDDAYYHVGSLDQFLTYSRVTGGADCATQVETSNFTPDVSFDYVDDFYIPVSTPFRLEGTATDANNDDLTFVWEQYDLGPSSPIREPRGNAPLFRSFRPSVEGNLRYFPQLFDIVQHNDDRTETLPSYSRDLTFRLVARDNNAEAGGVDWEEIHFFSDETAGPFLVNNPADTEWFVGDYREVTWDVANTDQAPVNCQRVNIVMSTDGGSTFDVVLVENVANNGSAFVTVPTEALSTEALIMVEAADNVFLNVNTNSFRVVPAVVPSFTLEPSVRFDNICLPDVVEIDLSSGSILDFVAPIALSIEEGDVPAGATVSFSSPNLTPGETATMTVDLGEVRFGGTLELTIIAVAEGLDTARRTVILEVTDNDYSGLATIAPAEGTAGIILATNFDWTDAVNADTYEIEIGSSPTFSEATIFERAGGLTGSEYLPAEFFAANTLYFWRIRPANVCGPGAWSAPNSFRTINSECNSFVPDDLPIGLPGSGPAFTRESRLFIEQSGSISDLNLPNVNIQYNFASTVTLALISPAGTRVVLYEEKCFSTNKIDLGFDDDAPINVTCPPDDRRVFKPEGSLAEFNNEDTFGEWILEVKVGETGGSAGSIQGWQVEFCADVSAVAPQSINNTATEVLPLGRSVILKEKLSVTSTAFPNELVQYTITDLPDAGRLMLYGAELMVGDTFQQDDINGLGLFYENTDDSADTDDFGFLVTTPDGGYLPIAYHDIIVTEGAITSNRSVNAIDAGLVVFPNPVGDVLSIRWDLAMNQQLSLELFDLNGRMLQQKAVAGATKSASLDMTALPSGVYLLRIDGAVRRIVKR
ncbi:MAG: subtilisin-like proprotein convertase family protein [Neolewinella sp.]|jgi:subtilisin-like proprotein convertase family protein